MLVLAAAQFLHIQNLPFDFRHTGVLTSQSIFATPFRLPPPLTFRLAGKCVRQTMADFLRTLDLAPTNADHIPPSGLSSVAEFGDHIARKSRSEPFWHHGIFKSQGESLGQYLVIDSFPHEGRPSVQTRTLDEFLGDDAEAAAIIRWGHQPELGRQLALYVARQYEAANSETRNLIDNNCEAFATLCWTGRCVEFAAVTTLLHTMQLPFKTPSTSKRASLVHMQSGLCPGRQGICGSHSKTCCRGIKGSRHQESTKQEKWLSNWSGNHCQSGMQAL